MNNGIFLGNLTDDVSLEKTKNGEDFCRITLCDNAYAGKDGDEVKTVPVFVDFALFGSKARAIKDLKKGDRFCVRYEIRNAKYEKDGVDVSSYNFAVRDISFCS